MPWPGAVRPYESGQEEQAAGGPFGGMEDGVSQENLADSGPVAPQPGAVETVETAQGEAKPGEDGPEEENEEDNQGKKAEWRRWARWAVRPVVRVFEWGVPDKLRLGVENFMVPAAAGVKEEEAMDPLVRTAMSKIVDRLESTFGQDLPEEARELRDDILFILFEYMVQDRLRQAKFAVCSETAESMSGGFEDPGWVQ